MITNKLEITRNMINNNYAERLKNTKIIIRKMHNGLGAVLRAMPMLQQQNQIAREQQPRLQLREEIPNNNAIVLREHNENVPNNNDIRDNNVRREIAEQEEPIIANNNNNNEEIIIRNSNNNNNEEFIIRNYDNNEVARRYDQVFEAHGPILRERAHAEIQRRMQAAEENIPEINFVRNAEGNIAENVPEDVARNIEIAQARFADARQNIAAANNGGDAGGIISYVWNGVQWIARLAAYYMGGKFIFFIGGAGFVIAILFPNFGVNMTRAIINTGRAMLGRNPMPVPGREIVPGDTANNLAVIFRVTNQIMMDNGPVFVGAGAALIVMRHLRYAHFFL